MNDLRIFVVSPHLDLFYEVRDVAAELEATRPGCRISVDPVIYIADVPGRAAAARSGGAGAADERTVLIVGEEARRDRSTKGEPDLAAHIDAIEEVRQAVDVQPFVLAATSDDRSIFRADDLDIVVVPVGFSVTDTDHVARIAQHLEKVLDGLSKDAQPLLALLEFNLAHDQATVSSRLMRGRNQVSEESCNYVWSVGDGPMHEFLAFSEVIDHPDNTELRFNINRNLQCIYDELLKAGCKIIGEGAIYEVYDRVTGRLERNEIAGIRLRIKTSPTEYKGLFEALCCDLRKDPIFVTHAACRSVDFGVPAKPPLPLNRTEPLNILVAIADDFGQLHELEGGAGSVGRSPQPLEFLDYEAAFFEKISAAGASDGVIALEDDDEPTRRRITYADGKVNVTVLKANQRASLRALIEAELTQGGTRYDLFHFAGHAHRLTLPNGADETILLLGRSGGPDRQKLAWLNLEMLCEWLSDNGVGFVYLNCCSAVPPEGGVGTSVSAAAVAEMMARRGVPRVLGFRWDVPDYDAYEFSRTFYAELLCNEDISSFDEALRRARRSEYLRSAGRSMMWAAPLLLLQANEFI